MYDRRRVNRSFDRSRIDFLLSSFSLENEHPLFGIPSGLPSALNACNQLFSRIRCNSFPTSQFPLILPLLDEEKLRLFSLPSYKIQRSSC